MLVNILGKDSNFTGFLEVGLSKACHLDSSELAIFPAHLSGCKDWVVCTQFILSLPSKLQVKFWFDPMDCFH